MVRAVVAVVALALASGARAERGHVHDVKRWAYQLQGTPRPSDDIDLLVTDPGGDGDRPLVGAAQVARWKARPGRSRRLVLAYLSIGEAENYRAYWNKSWNKQPPPFVAGENRAWRGNFKVRYWSPEWQAIVLRALDEIIDAGFDGAYLDIIDAFEYFGPGGARPERPTAAADMAAFVDKLAQHARDERHRPDFLIVPQNGANILEQLSPAAARAYVTTIDAIAVEDVFYGGRRSENNALHPDVDTLAALRRFSDARKPVLSVEYVTLPAKVREYGRVARERGFVPCVAPRELDHALDVAP